VSGRVKTRVRKQSALFEIKNKSLTIEKLGNDEEESEVAPEKNKGPAKAGPTLLRKLN
jgi:hypothetical protein